MSAREQVIVEYGHEEGEFYLSQVQRTEPFERNNHYHGTYEIYYLLAGRRYYFIKDASYSVAAGDLIFINKYDVHKTSVLGSPQHARIVMNFSDDFLGKDHPLFRPELLRMFVREPHQFRLKPQEQWHVERLLGRMAEEARRREEGFELSLRLLLTELLLLAARLKAEPADAAEDPLSPVHRKIGQVVKHLNAHFSQKLPLPELSAAFGLSPAYLSRTFKKITGFTIVGYQHLMRVREAQSLLAATDAKIADIAVAVGFEQFAHFNRTFKKLTGASPTRYRKLNRRP
ncbi:AraC-type DNA-binding protein [Paenibacillus sp. UNC496MF]|uniref:AraC family transcriptional regulator n=1 Tax=Paenibacillus sp. UNC496MF TaxID=1502753 RepID=UPI0008E4272F|nr:AraC family transcriptional regulator [Paenibacillus sp. UNC496MF]SFI85728.1 AraC-type DNA-binding protein [Paenibacillus sp. UNC496MF]